jgi:hypothetical protein
MVGGTPSFFHPKGCRIPDTGCQMPVRQVLEIGGNVCLFR